MRSELDRELARIQAIVHQQTGKDAIDVRLLPAERGIVVFMTVSISAPASLTDAHQQAGELEEALRKHLPQIADVVVHTALNRGSRRSKPCWGLPSRRAGMHGGDARGQLIAPAVRRHRSPTITMAGAHP
ncbi:MAG: cation transporter dimerization domain-containing protein [Solirubrobacteraceae bacterium]